MEVCGGGWVGAHLGDFPWLACGEKAPSLPKGSSPFPSNFPLPTCSPACPRKFCPCYCHFAACCFFPSGTKMGNIQPVVWTWGGVETSYRGIPGPRWRNSSGTGGSAFFLSKRSPSPSMSSRARLPFQGCERLASAWAGQSDQQCVRLYVKEAQFTCLCILSFS